MSPSQEGTRPQEAAGDGASDTMRGRGTANRYWTWVLLDADRRAVAAAVLVGLVASWVGLGAIDPVAVAPDGDALATTFQAFIAAIVTGVTLVVTINQLVLSQELGALGDQRERMRGSLEFRDDVESALGVSPAPAEPSAFLRALLEETRERAAGAAEAAREGAAQDRREGVEAFVEGLDENAAAVGDRLEGASFGSFAVLSAALDFNYAGKIYEARRLGQGASDGVAAELDRVIEALTLFGPTREHVKTLYFQWALIDLSRSVLYAAVPALVVATGMTLYAGEAGTLSGAALGVDAVVWVASAAAAVSLLPFVVLLAYMLRIATVAKRTLAIGPFVLRETGWAGDDGG